MVRAQWTNERLDRAKLEISEEELQKRIARVEPLILKDGELFQFDIPDLHKVAYTWSPKNLVEIDSYDVAVVELTRTFTHNSCGYHGFVKPSLDDVLAQLPNDPEINAFYLDIDSAVILHDGEGHLITCHWLKTSPSLVDRRK